MNKPLLSFKLKLFLIIVLFAPLVFLIIYINYDRIINPKSRIESLLERRSNEECIGRIDSIYRQKMNHNILVLQSENCVFQVEPFWEHKFKVGDSISKKKGELQVEHYRDGKLLELLDYWKYINKYYKKE